MKFFAKLERKLGKYAIRHLMRYVLALYIIGYIIYYVSIAIGIDIYGKYLMLDIDMLLKGQVWRLVTFLVQPADSYIIFLVFFLYLYYMIGEALEAAWGSFMFNLYYLSGVIFNILSVVFFYIVTKNLFGMGISYKVSLEYINLSLFLAFATLYPDVRLLLFFFIPVKIKWLGILDALLIGYNIVKNISDAVKYHQPALYGVAVSIVLAMANFLIFFFIMRKRRIGSPAMARQRAEFRRNMERAQRETGQARGYGNIARHKCAICGRTELDDDTLEFRFCTKCVGNYEYCTEHLYTHVHVGNMAGTGNGNVLHFDDNDNGEDL